MRIKYAKLITFFIIILNILIVYYIWKYFFSINNLFSLNGEDDNEHGINGNGRIGAGFNFISNKLKYNHNNNNFKVINGNLNNNDLQSIQSILTQKPIKNRIQTLNKFFKKSITLIFYDFYYFDNDLKNSIENILNIIPTVQILVLYNHQPYPPIELFNNQTFNSISTGGLGVGDTQTQKFKNGNVKFINLKFDINKKFHELNPFTYITTKFVLFMPDSVRINSRAILSKIIREFNNETKHNKLINNKLSESEIENSLDNDRLHQTIGRQTQKSRLDKLIAIPFNSNIKSINNCGQINLDFANWTMEYKILNTTNKCDMYLQKHAIILETSVLKDLPSPFSYPFPEMLYIQTKIANIKKFISNLTLQDGKKLFTSYHTKQKRGEIRKEQFKKMYKELEIKKIITKFYKHQNINSDNNNNNNNNNNNRDNTNNNNNNNSHNKSNNKINHNSNSKDKSEDFDGIGGGGGGVGIWSRKRNKSNNKNVDENRKSNQMSYDISNLDYFLEPPPQGTHTNLNNHSLVLTSNVQYYGCESNTISCIGQVYNSKPFYLYLNKHTPPCCMEKLKTVFHHVIDELDNVGIRYWLDNVALKSAVETNTLSLDAFEIDISFNVFDLTRSNSLKKSQTRPFIDDKGFYWIKATDGQYYKVQYSKNNNIGVNLLPFELVGEYIRPNGFYGWKAKEFSVEYLHPMSTVLFLGKNIMCPNNVNEFLELKQNFP